MRLMRLYTHVCVYAHTRERVAHDIYNEYYITSLFSCQGKMCFLCFFGTFDQNLIANYRTILCIRRKFALKPLFSRKKGGKTNVLPLNFTEFLYLFRTAFESSLLCNKCPPTGNGISLLLTANAVLRQASFEKASRYISTHFSRF